MKLFGTAEREVDRSNQIKRPYTVISRVGSSAIANALHPHPLVSGSLVRRMGNKSPEDAAAWKIPMSMHQPSRFRRLVNVVLLASLAVAFSTLLPSPWSILSNRNISENQQSLNDPASQWKDDIWPIRPQTAWDISTDYPYPRQLEYDVTEGTWLRLDVHPQTGEIVFDMLGDIYCLPADAYSRGRLSSGFASHARPILLGVPHDSDPHFSPDGSKMLFRSDAGLGIENIWVMNYTSCGEMDVRASYATGDLLESLNTKDMDEQLLAQGHRETQERKHLRLLREGRLNGVYRNLPSILY